MPIYVYECQGACGARQDAYRSIAERDSGPECCGVKAKMVIVPAHITPDIAEYRSPVTGKPVRGRRQHRDDLARNGCRLADPSEKSTFTRPPPDRNVNWKL